VVLSLPHLTALHSAEQKRIFRFALSKIRGNLLRIYAIHLESLVQWLPKSFSGKSIDLPEKVRVIRQEDTLVFTREPSAAHEIDSSLQDTILSQPGIYDFPSFHVEISLEDRKTLTAQAEPPVGATSVWLDADQVRWPLILRAWRPGDRFCPSGMGGSKKLQDFFVDRKIPREQRKHVLLLCDMEKICWIVGHRLDERVRVQPHTRRVLIATQHIQEKGVVTKE
jgi:tRNA(Ile)-lysidine synthase